MFRVSEILEATGARLAAGIKEARISSISTDSRALKPGSAFIAIKGDNFDGHDFIEEALKKGAGCIIVEPAKTKAPALRQAKAGKKSNIAFLEVKDTKTALGDIASYHRARFNIPVIAITGSNGKTTTKEIVAHLLAKRYKVLKNEGTKNNHIGLPLTLLGLNHSHELAVLEVGTNHFGEVNYLGRICQPNVAVITNVGPSHLKYLRNLNGVLKEKYALIKNLKNPRIAILNGDDKLLRQQAAQKSKGPFTITFGIKNRSDFQARRLKYSRQALSFRVNVKHALKLNTPARHNVYNALAATAVARLFGVDYADIARAIADFEFPKGRLKLMELNRLKIIDDTYNSNPLSLAQALETLSNFKVKGRKIFIMGDMLELGVDEDAFHRQAGLQAAASCHALIAVGPLSKTAADSARESGFDPGNIFHCDSCRQAQEVLFNRILPNKDDIILIKGSRAMRMEEIFAL